jgi:hypothetical protein
MTPVANLPPVSTTPAARLPPVSTTPAANLPPVCKANLNVVFAVNFMHFPTEDSDRTVNKLIQIHSILFILKFKN